MSELTPSPSCLWRLFTELRRHHFLIGPQDYAEARRAMQAGFGWESPQALQNLLCMLWAKSKAEREILLTLCAQDKGFLSWELPKLDPGEPGSESAREEPPAADQTEPGQKAASPSVETAAPPPAVHTTPEPEDGLPYIPENLELPNIPLLLLPEYPVAEREVAQAWRRLRRAVRSGPAVELDLEATIARRSQQGVAAEVVLRPRRRNTARLLLFVDQYGSMNPYRGFVEMVCRAIRRASNLQSVEVCYFHDTPVEFGDERLLAPLQDELFPRLDRILPDIPPSVQGTVRCGEAASETLALGEALEQYAGGAAVVIVSDAGAARGRYDLMRLLNTVAFLKALKSCTAQVAWLNPVGRESWRYGTARQIQRYAPMFEMDQAGFYQAVEALRGHPYPVEQPL